MICSRSGYCCIHLSVIIVDDPELGIRKGNLIHKESGVACKHLLGDKAGQHSCAIHNEKWYKDTPCFEYTQIEHENTKCRMGEYILKSEK